MSGPSLLVGRGPEADIAVADDSVSSRHAELSLTGDGRLYVTDCGSRNGTFVQQGATCERLRQGIVPEGATVFFGSCAIPAQQLLQELRVAAARWHGAAPAGPQGSGPQGWVRCQVCAAPRPRGTTCGVCGAAPSGGRR